MERKKHHNRITHQNGFCLIIEEGTFHVPYEISIRTKEGLSLSAHEVVRVITAGLQAGRQLEHQLKRVVLSRLQSRVRY